VNNLDAYIDNAGNLRKCSVAGLSGTLADDQHVIDAEVLAVAAALVHAARHENGGADEISVAALSGTLADDQHVLDAEVLAIAAALVHADRHEIGGADSIRWTASKLLLGAGAGADPTEVDLPTPGHEPASVGDVLVTSSDTEKTRGDSGMLKEIRLGRNGTYRVKFDLKCGEVGYPGYCEVQNNGVLVGAEQSSNSTTYATKSQDLSGFHTGDIISLYTRKVTGTAYVQNFRIYLEKLATFAEITA